MQLEKLQLGRISHFPFLGTEIGEWSRMGRGQNQAAEKGSSLESVSCELENPTKYRRGSKTIRTLEVSQGGLDHAESR